MLQEWRTRPLEEVYPFVFLDAIHYKVKEDGRYISKAFYTVLGVRVDGKKEILGLYLNESEGAKFWLQVLTDLQNRGVKDILIASVDGLKGFPEAINSVFPDTLVQLCVVHQIRNSLRFIGSANQKQFAKELMLFFESTVNRYPVTYPAFIKSKYCPISVSGLAIEVADLDFNNDDAKIEQFIKSNNWEFYLNACASYGFMVDSRMPWRLVADIGQESGKRMSTALGGRAVEPFEVGLASVSCPTALQLP